MIALNDRLNQTRNNIHASKTFKATSFLSILVSFGLIGGTGT